jgi:hypothetical protein
MSGIGENTVFLGNFAMRPEVGQQGIVDSA